LKGQRIGYVRVSSFDQNPDRQLEQVQVDKVFTDKASGKDTQRPQLDTLLRARRRYRGGAQHGSPGAQPR
jgi:DNA invertase Pin-like site-specific DNA recombinase